MSYDESLARLAAHYGIEDAYWDIWGGYHPTSTYTRQALLSAMHLPPDRIAADPEGLLAETEGMASQAGELAGSHAGAAYVPPPLRHGKRYWGLTVQLYSVRSRRNWGMGDFTDLAMLARLVGQAGGAFLGLNPLHALFPEQPECASPYSPSHRGFLNVLYLDLEALPEFAQCLEAQRRVASPAFQRRLARLRESEWVDYAGIAAAKLEILPLLWQQFQDAAEPGRRDRFHQWRAQQGETLERFARFAALQSHFHRLDPHCWGYPAWPTAYRHPEAAEVAAFAHEHAESIAYQAWLQWLAHEQLTAAEDAGMQAGLVLGLYLDLAVGARAGGAETWDGQALFAHGASAGAPPDELNLLGQDWGLPPYVPHRLAAADFRPFSALLAANMRRGGLLRVDHVMMLARLFWVPEGVPALEGAYVRYPFEAMLACLIEASQQRQCLVIGEDLGTVPEGFRERMAAADIFSYRPLLFQRDHEGQFLLPEAFPTKAIVAASTHDLPTLQGFWRGHDLFLRDQLGLFPNRATRERLYREREWDKGRLLWALERVGLLPPGIDKDAARLPELPFPAIIALHRFLARSCAQLLAVAAEDVFGIHEQTNVPGTTEAMHPNWRRKLPLELEAWAHDARLQALFGALAEERPR
ncbi:MAG: 4-alpha-glucanotransferase [Rhodocyclaceae bacterium]|nr:4-alpha-glucanotransferase [Rhodocyclaceae bacterium]